MLYKEILKHAVERKHVEQHFNPYSSPNFGGLWELGIKAVKIYITRVIETQTITYEELYTSLIQVEAVLNSRPSCAVSSDPNDFSCLTSGHFLTLALLNSLYVCDYSNVKLSHLSRWPLLQKVYQGFWWQREYLHTLMKRHKWTVNPSAIKVDTLVLCKDELSPPLKWYLECAEKVHPCSDGIVRVVLSVLEKDCSSALLIKFATCHLMIDSSFIFNCVIKNL